MVKSKKITTLVMVTNESNILLGLKKRGFGSGKWNGFGGKVEANESIEEAAKRYSIDVSNIDKNK
jgi:8-oxo-dGTP diphosphatase/2-hydroxy-dATP diphosphatase